MEAKPNTANLGMSAGAGSWDWERQETWRPGMCPPPCIGARREAGKGLESGADSQRNRHSTKTCKSLGPGSRRRKEVLCLCASAA